MRRKVREANPRDPDVTANHSILTQGCAARLRKEGDSRSLLAPGDDQPVSKGGVHGKHRPVVSSGHDSTQYVVFPHTDISTDGTCKRQVILKRSGEGEINSSKAQAESNSNSRRKRELRSPF